MTTTEKHPATLTAMRTISDAEHALVGSLIACQSDDRAQAIHFLRRTAELVARALDSFDSSLTEVVSMTDSGFAATEQRTAVDNEVPSQTGALVVPDQVNRFDLLTLAGAAVGRDTQYGPVDEIFLRTAEIWSAILGQVITSERVALCMAGLKLARLSYNPAHVDSWADVAGYAAIGAELGSAPLVDPMTEAPFAESRVSA